MLIVFEGVDGSGKTTIAKTFAEEKGFHYTREPTFSPEEADRLNLSKMNPAEREVEFMIDRIQHQKDIRKYPKVVSDRYVWSALAYARVFSNSMYSFLKTVYTNRFFKNPDCIVMVSARLDVCRQRSGRVQTDDQLRSLQSAYDDLRANQGTKVMWLDNSGALEDTMKDLYRWLGKFFPDLGPSIRQTSMFNHTEK